MNRTNDRPHVLFRCFGGFLIETGDTPVDLEQVRPKACALLRILVLHTGRDLHREWLEEVLWPGVEHVVARHRLQVAVSTVRSLLKSSGVRVPRHGAAYGIGLPQGTTTDVLEFERLVSEASRRRRDHREQAIEMGIAALGLYRGDLLPEDGPAEFVTMQRERFRLIAADTAVLVAEDCRALGDGARALASARESVRLNPYQDRAWEVLIALHEDADDRCAADLARRQYSTAMEEVSTTWPAGGKATAP